MNRWRKIVAGVLTIAMVASLAACGTPTESSSTPADTSSEASVASEVESEASGVSEVSSEAEKPTDDGETPRTETLYYGGEQWGKPVNMNPLSTTSNFGVMSQNSVATVVTWETLYMYNPLDGKSYPLLADGDYAWNDDRTALTVKTNPDATWSDGTPFTANDVVATWDIHAKAQTATNSDYGQYIDTVEATDDNTAVFSLKADNLNPLKVQEYMTKVYQMQKAYVEKIWTDVGEDSGEMKNATFWDAPITGAYQPTTYDSEQKWILTRREDYWGQAESRWGKLPVPKYIVHNILKDNDAIARAFQNGEIDINQAYTANLQDMWEKDGLPISTWFDEAPYQLGMSMPSAMFNTTKEGLDQVALRTAIAMAIDYDQIVSSAMTGQSYTFAQIPRSLFNPTDAEQAMIKDASVLEPYQYAGADYEGAQKVLDDAGIVDSDGDGIREYPAGNNLSFKVMCPTGWTDWNAALTIVSDAGQKIGINLETNFIESATYTADIQSGNFDISMTSYEGASPSAPWLRAYQTMYGFGGSFPETMTFNYGRYYNAEVDTILAAIPTETDEAKLKDYYEQLNLTYLQEVPAVSLMYRPIDFNEANETVWTNFPEEGDSIPPLILWDGYAYAGMFELELVG